MPALKVTTHEKRGERRHLYPESAEVGKVLVNYASETRLTFLAVDINTDCHYRCWFCSARNSYPSLPPAEMRYDLCSILRELSRREKALRVVWVSGLEPIFNLSSVRKLVEIREALPGRCMLGVTTAGARLCEFAAHVSKTVDFINLSIDGLESTADRIRGPGAFRKALRGIEGLLEHGFSVERIVPAAVATPGNWREIPSLIVHLGEKFSLTRFSINLTENVGSGKCLRPPAVVEMLRDLSSVAAQGGFEISVSCSPLSIPDLFGLLGETEMGGLSGNYERDCLGFPLYSLNGRYSMRLEYTPLLYGMVAKIDANGWLLARVEDLHPRRSVPVGNVFLEGEVVFRRLLSVYSPGMLQIAKIRDKRWVDLLRRLAGKG